MKERRGPLGRTVGAVAQGIAGAARRRQEERAPRVLVYDRFGQPTLLAGDRDEQAALIDLGLQLVELAARPTADARGEEDPLDEAAAEDAPTAAALIEDPLDEAAAEDAPTAAALIEDPLDAGADSTGEGEPAPDDAASREGARRPPAGGGEPG